MAGKVVLITGCSSGLGKALALAALDAGLRVVATARDESRIQDLKVRGAATLSLDVTWSPAKLQDCMQQAIGVYGKIDFLINNAGYMQAGSIEENSDSDTRALFDVLVFGVLEVTKALLPHFRERKSGTLVNISSLGPSLNLPGAGLYCAAKAAVESLSDTWSKEVALFGISSFCVQPAVFQTDIANSRNLKFAANTIPGYEVAQNWATNFHAGSGTEPGDTRKAAARIIEVMTLKVCDGLPQRFALGEEAIAHLPDFYRKRAFEVETWAPLGDNMRRTDMNSDSDWKGDLGEDDKRKF